MVHLPNGAEMLRVVDLRTRPSEDYSRNSAPSEMVICLNEILRAGGGEISRQWDLRIGREFFVPHPFCLPGTAFGPGAGSTNFQPLLGGVGFEISASPDTPRADPCLLGWVAWEGDVFTEILDDIDAVIKRHRACLGSLCPFEEIEPSRPLPWLAVMRMRPWIELLPRQQAELRELQAWIGWSAVEALSGT